MVSKPLFIAGSHGESAFSDYAARLESWAAANGKRFGTDVSGNENVLLSKAVSSPFVESAKGENTNLFIAIALAFLLAATAGGFAFTMQKRGKRE